MTDAAVFDEPGPSAARRLCLDVPPTHSFVLARIPVGALPAPLRVPTAADAACRPQFQVPPEGATAGITCSGNPELVTRPVRLEAVADFRLSR